MHPLGCTFFEIMRPEQILCVYYAGRTPKWITVAAINFRDRAFCIVRELHKTSGSRREIFATERLSWTSQMKVVLQYDVNLWTSYYLGDQKAWIVIPGLLSQVLSTSCSKFKAPLPQIDTSLSLVCTFLSVWETLPVYLYAECQWPIPWNIVPGLSLLPL
jgi:hypothetical protein